MKFTYYHSICLQFYHSRRWILNAPAKINLRKKNEKHQNSEVFFCFYLAGSYDFDIVHKISIILETIDECESLV